MAGDQLLVPSCIDPSMPGARSRCLEGWRERGKLHMQLREMYAGGSLAASAFLQAKCASSCRGSVDQFSAVAVAVGAALSQVCRATGRGA